MHFVPPDIGSWFNLPRDGGVAYVAQESWVQNDTIRNNILFGSAFEEERYRKGRSELLSLSIDMCLLLRSDQTMRVRTRSRTF